MAETRSRTGLVIVVLVALAGATWVVLDSGSWPSSNSHDAAPRDAGPPTVPPPGDRLAPASYVPSELDAVPGLTLRLGLVHPDGRARICDIGQTAGVAPALDRAVCRAAPRDEARGVPPRRDEVDAGDVVLRVERGTGSPAGDSLVVAPQGGEAPSTAPLPFVIERVRACRSGEALAIAVEGPVEHDVRPVAFFFHGATGLSAPISATAQIFDQSFTCRGDESTMSWIEPVRETQTLMAHQLRCRGDRCDAVQARLSIAGSDPVVSDLAGKLLVIWTATDGTRIRLAPITELDRTPDITGAHDPRLPILARKLFVRGGTAVLVLRTAEGSYGLRIDARGNVEPLPVTVAGSAGG